MKTVSLHQIEDLVKTESEKEIFLQTQPNTELHIIKEAGFTTVKLPFGNKFDIIDGQIIIYEKY